jgi:hypothetical protein
VNEVVLDSATLSGVDATGHVDVDRVHSVEELQDRGRIAMGRSDYAAAANYFALADKLAPRHDDAPGRLFNRAIRQLVPR